MELRTDERTNIAYIKMTGRLSRQSILDAFDAVVADPRYKPGMARLWDFRWADLSTLSSSTIAEMAKYSTRFPSGINDVKVAFVTNRALEFGLSRMFEAHSTAGETEVSVYYTMEEAESWLSAPRCSGQSQVISEE